MAFLFPGHGAQSSGMLARIPDTPAVRRTFAEATAMLGYSISHLDSPAALRQTEPTQLALFVAAVAGARMLAEEGITPAFLTGHSGGAFAAAVCGGVVSIEEGLHLVRLRGSTMQTAFPSGFGMATITGVPRPVCEDWIHQVSSEGGVVYAACYNAPDQLSISGATESLNRVLDLAQARGVRKATRLEINAPSHTPLMLGVAEKMWRAMQGIVPRNPVVPYASSRTARLLFRGEAVLRDLAYSVAEPVQWHEVVSLLYENGVRNFAEMYPGDILTNLASKAFPDVRCLALERSGAASLAAAIRTTGIL